MGRRRALLLAVASATFPTVAFASDQTSAEGGVVEITGPVLFVSDLEGAVICGWPLCCEG
jgi:hypothetical protein